MKPILFNTEMVRAILDGRKTVTRRVVKPQPLFKTTRKFVFADEVCPKKWEDCDNIIATYQYQPGDVLYVRETWARTSDAEVQAGVDPDIYFYKADVQHLLVAPRKWRPSIHMPKEAARIFLRVTSVRVERLQKPFFEHGSCIFALRNEGVEISEHCQQCIENYGSPCCNDLDPDLELNEETGEDESGGSECGILDDVRYDFSRLWDSTIKPADCDRYGWGANPFVWVIEFERISREKAEK